MSAAGPEPQNEKILQGREIDNEIENEPSHEFIPRSLSRNNCPVCPAGVVVAPASSGRTDGVRFCCPKRKVKTVIRKITARQ
jgi:hypothetical protein